MYEDTIKSDVGTNYKRNVYGTVAWKLNVKR